MSHSTVTIEIEKYFTPSGAHTCGTDFSVGDCCMFCAFTHYGTVPVCLIAKELPAHTKIYTGEEGYLVPLKDCILKDK